MQVRQTVSKSWLVQAQRSQREILENIRDAKEFDWIRRFRQSLGPNAIRQQK